MHTYDVVQTTGSNRAIQLTRCHLPLCSPNEKPAGLASGGVLFCIQVALKLRSNPDLLTAAQRMHIDSKLLDRRFAEAADPGWHDAMLGSAYLRNDLRFGRALEPDAV